MLELTVNGKQVRKPAKTHMRLLDFLREELYLTGTKEGCGEGECGTCSVRVNGELIKSCLMPAVKAQGADVVTIEGLAKDGKLHPVQQAFIHAGASQCGFCIPGMVMAAADTLEKNPHASPEELREGISGNICRCTGYRKIFEAMDLAAEIMTGRCDSATLDIPQEAPPSYIGTSVPRVDAKSKVTGALKYAADMTLPNMLHVKVLRSPFAHARIKSIDTSLAEAMEGVEAVLTYKDVPGEDGFGVFVLDQPSFAREKVRFVGETVAAVAAETEIIAREALAKIKVEYEPLPALFDPEEAMAEGAPVLHNDYPKNLSRHVKIRKGDVAEAMARAEIIVEGVYGTQVIEHAYLEPEAGIAYLEPDDTLTIVSPSQNITHHRHDLAKILNRPINKIRCIMSPVGGGFGGKEDQTVQPIIALAVLKTGRPAKYVFTREESFIVSAKRHPFRIRYRTGMTKDGRIIASECRIIADTGAYAQSGPGVMVKAAVLSNGPYQIDNVWVDSISAYTNNTPSGAMRGFGATQMHFATETQMDRCAERVGMDPLAFRRLNCLRDGDETHTGQALPSVSLLRTIEGAAKAAGWEEHVPGSRHGRTTAADRVEVKGS